MAHQLEIKGKKASMMYVGETPWHGLGTKLNNPPTSAEAMKAASMDWKVALFDMFCPVPLPGNPDNVMQAESRMVIRTSDGKKLSEVGPKWTPLQNEEAFTWFDPFLESGEASLETAGTLYGGQRVWVMAKLNRDPMVIVGDDVVNKYLLLSNAHSAVRSARVALTPVRVVCANTEAMAFSNKNTNFLSVRHSKNIKEAMENVRSIINTANASFEATAEQYRALTKVGCDSEQLKKYVLNVFPPKKKEEEDAEETGPDSERNEEDSRLIVNKIIPLFEDGKGAQMKGVRGTMWGAYNAVSEFLNWHRGRTADARMDSVWFGQSAKANKTALTEALKFLR